MKTALETLIEEIDLVELYYQNELSMNHEPHVKQILEGKLTATTSLKKEAQILLPIEREQIEVAFIDGKTNGLAEYLDTTKGISSTDYFNKTFK